MREAGPSAATPRNMDADRPASVRDEIAHWRQQNEHENMFSSARTSSTGGRDVDVAAKVKILKG